MTKSKNQALLDANNVRTAIVREAESFLKQHPEKQHAYNLIIELANYAVSEAEKLSSFALQGTRVLYLTQLKFIRSFCKHICSSNKAALYELFISSRTTLPLFPSSLQSALVSHEVIRPPEATQQLSLNKPDQEFIGTLDSYFIKRNFSSYNIFHPRETIEQRKATINRLIQYVKQGNIDAQLEFLNSEHIAQFRGLFSQNLYDILLARREYLEQNNNLSPTNKTLGLS